MFFKILSILLLIVLLILLYDFYPTVLNWIGRMKIGTSDDWSEATRAVIEKWLLKGTPRVALDDKKRLKLIDDIKNIGKQNSVAYWQDAAVLKAANAASSASMKKGAQVLVDRYIDLDSGEWREEPTHVDSAMLCFEILSSPYFERETVEPAMTYVAEMLKSLSEKYGTVPYNEDVSNVRFVDTVGMICPFLIKYAAVYKRDEFIGIAVKQIKEYMKYGLDKNGIPAHCFDVKTKNPLGIYGWGRGCAWWALGVTESLKSLLECKGHNTEKAVLLKASVGILDEMENYQNADGSFSRMIYTPSLRDSSAGAMLAYCYSFMHGLVKDKSYAEASKNVLEHLKSCTRRDGTIDYSQGDTMGIGFYSDSLSVLPAAQGFAVAADYMIN